MIGIGSEHVRRHARKRNDGRLHTKPMRKKQLFTSNDTSAGWQQLRISTRLRASTIGPSQAVRRGLWRGLGEGTQLPLKSMERRCEMSDVSSAATCRRARAASLKSPDSFV
ncbi:hypothetical protein CERZMDRAFT_89514 [Cercospora zeae-maydis SCOH1-5]|uniref:Uncharacterized protein n=1 Tax=Cercospora zeae-maydis SCOH1-5 TaxID=717836 RepID=A0A6A6FVE3_9PEZI|nr:hypothetical protein CERZMDRAFT_89514 [Cercospora zeae-maydis SCOH1-5]